MSEPSTRTRRWHVAVDAFAEEMQRHCGSDPGGRRMALPDRRGAQAGEHRHVPVGAKSLTRWLGTAG